jgi:hypothetical protein
MALLAARVAALGASAALEFVLMLVMGRGRN